MNRGLPLDMWDERTFERTGKECERLQEIDQRTKDMSSLLQPEFGLENHG